ncbi:DUF1178 family protein [Cupriavidus sp. 2TAF22]|uniref:DUF1178 family protein n=1 Tax=unclassified Cupriavidus TaxID=2640874 RepID=UPI003F92707D
MKVLDLRCAQDHRFEGWFASEDDAQAQILQKLVQCPICADHAITRLPSAPRLNLSGATAAPAGRPAEAKAPAAAAVTLQSLYMKAVRQVLAQTEDVGERFAEEARRMHYDETPERGIRGTASPDEVQALAEEGIDTFQLVVPDALKQTAH